METLALGNSVAWLMGCSDLAPSRVVRALFWACGCKVIKTTTNVQRSTFSIAGDLGNVACSRFCCSSSYPRADWGRRWGFRNNARRINLHSASCLYSGALGHLGCKISPNNGAFSLPCCAESSQTFGSSCGVIVPHYPADLCCGRSYSLFVRKCSEYLSSSQLQKVALRLVSYKALKRKPRRNNKIAALKAVERIVPGGTLPFIYTCVLCTFLHRRK